MSSFGWAFFGRIASQLLQVIGTIVLGRLLLPADFGIIAAATVVITLGQIFTDLGLGPAVVQRENLTHTFLETAFWLNAVSGLMLSLISLAAAWPLSWWYHMPQLKWVIPTVGLTFSLSLSAIGLAIMERQFRFRTIIVAEFFSVLVGQACGIAIALYHPSVLALAIGPVISTATLSILILSLCGWRPQWRIRFHRADFGDLRVFAGYLSIFNIATFSARNSDDFLLGRFVTAQALGFYSRSYQLMLLPVSQVGQALSRTLQPSFARAKSNRTELQRLHTLAEVAAAAIGFPASVILYSLAPSGIPLVLGERWRPMITIFQIFAISIPAQVLGVVNGSLYTATGNVRRLLATGAFTSTLLVTAFAFAVQFGTTAVALVFTIHSFVTLPFSMIPILRKLRLRVAPIFPRIAVLGLACALLFFLLNVGPRVLGYRDLGLAHLVSQLSILGVVAVLCVYFVRRVGVATLIRLAQGPGLRE